MTDKRRGGSRQVLAGSMKEFAAAMKRLRTLASELRMINRVIGGEAENLSFLHDDLLEQTALIADQVEATAEPGHGKETAAEIGRRIRALIEVGNE